MTTGRPVRSATATALHRLVWPVNGSPTGGAGGQVPHPHRLVAAAGDDHRPPVQLRHRHRVAPAPLWPVNGSPTGGAGGQVPHPHRLVAAAGDDHRPAVQLRHRHRVHRAGVAGERVADRGAGGQVPHPHRLVAAAGDDHRPAVQLRHRHRSTDPVWPVNGSPTGAPVARSHTRTVRSPLPEMTTGRPSSSATATAFTDAGVAGERVADRGAGGQVPHPHRPVAAAGDDHGPPVQLRHRHAAPSRCGR